MLRKTPPALKGQLESLEAAAEAAALWFKRPAPSALSAAHTARLRARGWREEALGALKSANGHAKSDAADLSFALREAVEHAAQAAAEAARWGLVPDEEFAKMAEAFREGSKALSRAAASKPARRAEALVEAKRWASEIERRRRRVRADSHETPYFVEGVRRAEVASRWSAAAESLQQACDALAGSLAE